MALCMEATFNVVAVHCYAIQEDTYLYIVSSLAERKVDVTVITMR